MTDFNYCLRCTSAHTACHDTCPKYKVYKEHLRRRKEWLKEQRNECSDKFWNALSVEAYQNTNDCRCIDMMCRPKRKRKVRSLKRYHIGKRH